MPTGYSPIQTVDVDIIGGNNVTVEYAYFFGDNPDTNGWTESWNAESGLELTVWLVCRWEDRINLIRALRGQVATTGPLSVERRPPSFVLNPPFGDDVMQWNRFVCTSIGEMNRIKTRIMQEDEEIPGALFADEVVLPCNFEAALYYTEDGSPPEQSDPSGMPYTVTRFRDAGEIVQPAAGAYIFKGTNVIVQDQAVGFYFPRSEIQVRRVFMPYSGCDQLQEIKGCVNANPVRFPDHTFPTGTLLMTGIDPEPYSDPGTGRTVWDIVYTMEANAGKNGDTPVPWSRVMNSEGVYKDVVTKVGGDPPFPSADFMLEIWPEYV